MLKLYFDLLSQPSRALYIFFELAKVPHEKIPVPLRNGMLNFRFINKFTNINYFLPYLGAHLTDEFKENVNRFQKVPCINDNGFKLAETIAILRYVEREYKIPDFWYPKDSHQRARVDEYMEWQHNNTRLTCAMFFQAKWLIPLMTGKQPSENKVTELKTRMEGVLDIIENTWLEPNKFIAGGNKLSIADLLALCEMEQTKMTGYDPCLGRPKMTLWWEKVRSELNPTYDTAHDMVYKISKKAKEQVNASKL